MKTVGEVLHEVNTFSLQTCDVVTSINTEILVLVYDQNNKRHLCYSKFKISIVMGLLFIQFEEIKFHFHSILFGLNQCPLASLCRHSVALTNHISLMCATLNG